MKHATKFAGILLAVVMVFAMAVTAFAGENTITVTGAQKGETYSIYKMLDLKVNDAQTAYSYTVNSDWTDFFTGTGAGAQYVDIENGYVTWKTGKDTASDMEAFGKAAASYAAVKSLASVVTAIKPSTDGEITFSGLDAGYYLITSTNGTLAMVYTTPDKPSATINEKNADSVPDKLVQEDIDSKWYKENSAQIGDTVEFKVTLEIKKGARNYVLHDKMEDGLTFNANSVEIAGLTNGTEYTVVTTGLNDDCTFEIRFEQSYLDTLTANTNITVTYDAVLNEKVDVVAGEKNDIKLTWGDSSTSEWSETVTKTYKFEVLKYAAGDTAKKHLAGATFQLKDAADNVVKLIKVSDTEYRVANGAETGAVDSFVTVASGNIVIKGVDLDAYTLVETAAPTGYNLLKDPLSVTVEAANSLVVDVPNASGTELPSTGGIGTTVFYIVGSVLVVGAVVLLVTRKRMGAKN